MVGEILNINNEYKHYREYKAAVDEELKRSAESFVRIGYLLKVARDTDILVESGYKNVNDFAQVEYGLDKSQVSRFIRVNDEFSEGGYSDRLQEKFQRFGYTKLSIMLMLPTAVNEELTESFSKADIIAVKEEVEAEQKISDLEVLMEEKEQWQQSCGIFGKVLYQLGKDKPELYQELFFAVKTASGGILKKQIRGVMDILAPTGEAIHSVRIAGEGRKLLSIRGEDKEPVVTDIRSGEKESCPWNHFILELEDLFEGTDAKESWENLYGEAFPKEEKKEASVLESRKQTKVHKAKETKKNERPVERPETKVEPKSKKNHGSDSSNLEMENTTKEQPRNVAMQSRETKEPGSATDNEEQLPGQMTVENYPELLPDDYKVAPVQPTVQGVLVKESMCLEELKAELEQVYTMADKREYEKAKEYMVKAAGLLERLQKLMEVDVTNGKETA